MWTRIENESFRKRSTRKWYSLLYWKIDLKPLRLGSNSCKNIWGFTDFIFSYFPPNQTILKPKTLTNISRHSDIKTKNKKKEKEKGKENIENHLGIFLEGVFLEYFKFFEVSSFIIKKKKHFGKWFSKNHF